MKTKILVIGMALLAVMVWVNIAPVLAQVPFTIFDKLQVDHDANFFGPVTAASTLAVTGASTFTGAVTADDVAVGGVLNTADTDSVLTGAQTITPTYSYLQVAPTALLTITLATGSATDGDLLVIHNTVATNTNIVDTGATVGGGAIDLGANDIAIFIFGNSKWVELASPDNS